MISEVEGIVLAMWDEPYEEIVLEVKSAFDVSQEKAEELVKYIMDSEDERQPDESQEWYDFDPFC